MEDWQQRVVDEQKQLEEKVIKLFGFLQSKASDNIVEEDKRLLRKQFYAMADYNDVLKDRIKRF